MREDTIRPIAEKALSRLAAELEAGHSDVLREYLAAQARFHRYSWTNTLLIHSQRPTATRVAGYHSWRDLGRWVRQGEKGIAIYAPIVTKVRETETPSVPRESADVRRVVGFRAAYVFDVEQTEGRPLPAFSQTTGDPKQHLEKLKEIVARSRIALNYDVSIAPAQGRSEGGTIRLLPSLAPSEEFSTLAHEFAHELLHHRTDSLSMPQVVRETQAEAVAFVVSHGIGLETNRAASDYIALYNGDAKLLAESLNTIQETASQILKDLLPDERQGLVPAQTSRDGPREIESTRSSGEHGAVHKELGRSSPGPEPSDSLSWDR